MQNQGVTVETCSDYQMLLQLKEMHMDKNCQEDLEACTIEIEEDWKQVEIRKEKGKTMRKRLTG